MTSKGKEGNENNLNKSEYWALKLQDSLPTTIRASMLEQIPCQPELKRIIILKFKTLSSVNSIRRDPQKSENPQPRALNGRNIHLSDFCNIFRKPYSTRMIFTALICDEPHGSHADKDDASEWHDHHKIPFIRMKDCALRWNSFFWLCLSFLLFGVRIHQIRAVWC